MFPNRAYTASHCGELVIRLFFEGMFESPGDSLMTNREVTITQCPTVVPNTYASVNIEDSNGIYLTLGTERLSQNTVSRASLETQRNSNKITRLKMKVLKPNLKKWQSKNGFQHWVAIVYMNIPYLLKGRNNKHRNT